MDTNQNNNNNILINSFTKGMNTDTSLDIVGAEQYVFGLNIRITNNTNINGDITSNTNENIIAPIPVGETIPSNFTDEYDSILASAAIENVAAVITKTSDNKWHVYRIVYTDDEVTVTKVFDSTNTTDKKKFSIVLNKELEGYTKLYIADGKRPIMCINIDKSYIQTSPSDYRFTEDNFISNRIFPKDQITIAKKISGQLKTQQVQYTYRFYDKYGVSSKLAPYTCKVQVMDNNRNKELGNANDTVTSIGFNLRLSYPTSYKRLFDHIQVFRISYIKANQQPEIHLIYDAELSKEGSTFSMNDTGAQSLAEYSVDEFSALNSSVVIPQVIELNQGVMFAGNIEDDSTFTVNSSQFDTKSYQYNPQGDKQGETNYYVDVNSNNNSQFRFTQDGQYLGGTGPNISWKFVTTPVVLDSDRSSFSAPNYKLSNNTKNTATPNKLGHMYYIDKDYQLVKSSCETSTYFSSKHVYYGSEINYNDIFASSVLRSLRRDEVYRYGIVLYDEHGIRSDALWIADIRTPSCKEFDIVKTNFVYEKDNLDLEYAHSYDVCAFPLGIEFEVHLPDKIGDRKILSYQIVRCLKSDQYTKNILQVALSRPYRLGKANDSKYRTSYYPNYFLSTQFGYFAYNDPSYYTDYLKYDAIYNEYFDKSGTNCENNNLLQAFTPEMNFFRNDVINKLGETDAKLCPLYYVDLDFSYHKSCTYTTDYEKEMSKKCSRQLVIDTHSDKDVLLQNKVGDFCHTFGKGVIVDFKRNYNYDKNNKIYNSNVFKLYNRRSDIGRFGKHSLLMYDSFYKDLTYTPIDILNVADVLNPTWEEGFTDVQLSGSNVNSTIKQYKSFITNVGTNIYTNWVCSGTYDAPSTENEAIITPGLSDRDTGYRVFTDGRNGDVDYHMKAYIGPGPVCALLGLGQIEDTNILVNNAIWEYSYTDLLTNRLVISNDTYEGTIIGNIQHTAVQYSGSTEAEKQYDVYYGFGNYYAKDVNYSGSNKMMVFDGDVYITPAEFITMFKTYNFNDKTYSLQSNQTVYYIPMESKVNTYLDYGMNYRNTASPNIQLEPGVISGVASQNRPVSQINSIFSENDTSLEMIGALSIENQIEKFDQRVYYSVNKTNGENIDNWHVFKPIDFIDTDTRYGELTNLLTVKNNLYYWQNSAFGKFSVNERSLVTDNNNNTIQLGQGGVLQRADYIDTIYGMRKEDMSAISVEDTVFWIDSNNKTVVMSNGNNTVDFCEQAFVKNLSNSKYADILPRIDYDSQNMELLCKYLVDNNQLVFNVKANAATSVYNRKYECMLYFNNIILGLNDNVFTKYNYIKGNTYNVASPTVVSFVVNQTPSITKVFDNQFINTLKRNINAENTQFMATKLFKFETELGDSQIGGDNIEFMTDREGNINYAIPRENNADYGNRMRGRWMKVTITDNNPDKDFTISHVLTKFRKSYN